MCTTLLEITPVCTAFVGDYPVCTTFVGDYHCVHYFCWRLLLCALLLLEITAVCTTFVGDYPCVHYFCWRLPLCALLLLEITAVHYFCWRLLLCALLLLEITLVYTTFVGDYHCVHYFYWRLPLCALLLCSSITTPTYDIAVSWIISLKLYTQNIKINIQSIVILHKNKNKFVMLICGDHVHSPCMSHDVQSDHSLTSSR